MLWGLDLKVGSGKGFFLVHGRQFDFAFETRVR